jgi:uncharacterized phage infection (PIP) family protein YhgE
MTEEVKKEEVVEEKPQVTESTEPELSEVEQQAYKEGWRPKEQFAGDEGKWIPADEFMRRKPLFERIDSLKSETFQTRKELTDLKKTMKELADHHKRVRETEYQRAIDDLKAQRRLALRESDVEAVEAIEEKMDQVKTEKVEFEAQQKAEQKQQAQVGPTPEFVQWVQENPWYNTNKEMHDFAEATGAAYIGSKPNASPKEVFEYVNKQTRRAFPETFESARARRPSPVDSGETTSSRPSRDDFKLSPVEEEVARRFEESGAMTRKQYIEELKRTRGR